MWAEEVLQSAADLVLGGRCAACGRPGLGACARCVEAVTGTRPFRVDGLPSGLPPVFVAGAYDAELRRLIIEAKERNALGLLPLLASRLAAALAAWVLTDGVDGPIVVVPVPTAPSQVVERGVDLTSTLARLAAGRLRRAGLPARAVRWLRLVRRPLDQSELGREQRLANLTGAFVAGRTAPSGRVVLVDDIVTTGATLVEATRACAAAGRAPSAAAAVAATVRWSRSAPGQPDAQRRGGAR